METDLDAVVREANAACAGGEVYNLFLRGVIPVTDFERPFSDSYKEEAELWQAKDRPAILHINHGTYIHRAGDAYDYLLRELLNKPDSNRALVSLIAMDDIIHSGDHPLPSFLILQVSRVRTTLYATAYFRALEVSKFLTVNLTEIAMVIWRLHQRLPEIRTIELCVHAFRAYIRENTDLLHRAEIDLVPAAKIVSAVIRHDIDRLRLLLEGKIRESTVIETQGLSELAAALEEPEGAKYNSYFKAHIRAALATLAELRVARQTASHSDPRITVKLKKTLR